MRAGRLMGLVESVMVARAARRYYFENRSKIQIAEDLGISRFKVAQLLDLARASGLVTITISSPGSVNVELGEQLCQHFGLRRGRVVNTSQHDDNLVREQLGASAAELLREIASPDDVLGIGWARTVLAMANSLDNLRVKQVVQLTGVLNRPDVEVSGTELVRDVAHRAHAEAFVFYAPMIVSDPAAARGLRRQEQFARAFSSFDSVTKAVVGIGGWDPPSSTLHDALTPPEQELLRRSGVQADLSGVLLDGEGRATETPLGERIVGISAAQLRRVPDVIGIAYGVEKVCAAHAAIRGGYIQSLVTNTEFAERLLARF
jgi:DNA-binding transcriptional regulator LsrR (DeoR family)